MMESATKASRKGSAILIALGLGLVLLLIISGVYTFTSYRIQNTIQESLNLKALAIAEAGISCAITELSQNYGFRTHTVNRDLSWGTPVDNAQTLDANSGFGFSVKSNSKGTYQGTLGEGEFRVRVGLVPCEDDPRTLNIDERYCFFKIESMGKVGNTVRFIKGIIQRRFPGREFLMYDGDFLSVVYGQPGHMEGGKKTNKFMIGRLYGHKGLEIGQILNSGQSPVSPGSKQQIMNIDLISSGDGGVFIYNDTRMTFRDSPTTMQVFPKNCDFPLNGTYSSQDARQHGEYPKELRDRPPPAIPEKFKTFVRSKASGANSIPPKPIPFEDYKKQAQTGGRLLKCGDGAADAPDLEYKMPPGWGKPSEKCKLLDFGNNIREGKAKAVAPANGVIYSDDNIIVRGNPPRDLKIVSKKNIFIAGDLNQAGQWKQTGFPDVKSERYGLPQNYKGYAAADAPDDPTVGDYKEDSTLGEPGPKKKLLDDGKPGNFQHHKALTLIAQERAVLDYRSPVDCFENELYPFMKYKLGAAMKDQATAKLRILKVNPPSSDIPFDAADKAEAKNRIIASFFNDFPLKNTADQEAFAEKMASAFDAKTTPDRAFSDDEMDHLSKELWSKFAANYDANSMQADYGVYKLLNDLIKEVNPKDASGKPTQLADRDDDYLFFPEMTVNAMVISCGKRNTSFYAGPDYSKSYDEIGRSPNPAFDCGIHYADMDDVLQRVFGSEIRYSNYPVHRIGLGAQYEPMTRRKIYDESLPSLGLGGGGGTTARDNEVAAFVLLSWRDYRALPGEFTPF